MIVDEVIFGSDSDKPLELNPGLADFGLTCFVSTAAGTSTTTRFSAVIMFAYPGNSPAYAKTRTHAGHPLLQRFQQ